jgi:hypothetical protein
MALATVVAPAVVLAQDEDEGARSRPRRIEAPTGGASGGVSESVATAGGGGGAGEQVTPARVYVVSVAMEDGLEAMAQRAGAAARAALREMEGVAWRDADRRFLGYDESAVGVLERARERLQAGRQAYLNLDLPAAIEHLTAAVSDFDAAAAALEDPQGLGEALLFLGASLAFEGRNREASRVFTRLHVQMPHVQPDPNVFNPDVLSLFEAARPRDASNPQAAIMITSEPPGAIAYVDFLPRGITPITVRPLRGGEHVVRVTRAGATPFVQRVTVRSRQQAQTSAYLVDDEASRGLAEALTRVREADVTRLTDGNPIREIARILQVDRIGVIRASSADSSDRIALELLVFDAASGRRLVRGTGTVPTSVGELERGVGQLVSGALQAALTARQETDTERIPALPPEPPPAPAPPPAEPSVVEQWWFWAIIGGAAVVTAAAIGIGIAAANQGPGIGSDQEGYVVLEF